MFSLNHIRKLSNIVLSCKSNQESIVKTFRSYSVGGIIRHNDHNDHDHDHDHGGHDEDNVNKVEMKWVLKNGETTVTQARIGSTLLNVARANNIDLEGACEGVRACSTCHVILEPKYYDSLPEPIEEEEDMLDQAFGLTSTSRLGCQCIVRAQDGGITIELPKFTRNFYVVSASYVVSFNIC
jgi:2Fe-2S ferredoxin